MIALLKRLIKTVLLTVSGFIAVSSVFGQQQTFTLASLVDSASRNFPSLLQKQAQLNSARANEVDVRHQYLPKLTVGDELSIASANDVAGTYLPFPGIIHATSAGIRGDNNYAAQTGNIASLYAEYELTDFGLREAKAANAAAYTRVQQADYNKEVYTLKWQISRYYFDIIKTQYQLSADEQNISRYQSVLTIIAALVNSGLKAGVDTSLARAELSKARVAYNHHKGTLLQLQQQLSYFTGIPAAIVTVDTAWQSQVILPEANTGSDSSFTNPLLAYYNSQKSLYVSAGEVAKKSFLPKVVVAGGGWGRGSSIQYNDDYKSLASGLGYQRFNYAAGIGITYDLFSGIHRKDKLAVNTFNTKAAEYELQKQQLMLANTAGQADAAIKTAADNLLELPVQLQSAREAWQQKTAQYQAGMINLVDLTNTTYILYTAQLGYADALNEWYIASLNKAAATGTLDLFIQSLKK